MDNKNLPRRPAAQRSSLDALDKVLASLPEEQYDHTAKQPAPTQPVSAAPTKQPAQAPQAQDQQAPQAQDQQAQSQPAQNQQKRRGRRPNNPSAEGSKQPAPAQQKSARQKPAQTKKPAPAKPAQDKGGPPAQQGAKPKAAPAKQPRANGAQQNAHPGRPAQAPERPAAPLAPAQPAQNQQKRRGRPPRSAKNPLKIIPLGGLGEIGKNLTAYEFGEDIIIVDCGFAFPDEEMLGVDSVIPDFTYLEENRDRLRALFVTHGHEDHIGAIPYLLQSLNIPVYSARFTIALIEGKLRETGILGRCKLNVVKPREAVTVGCFTVEFITVNHSIPDACALAITSPVGVVIQTGDFKVDYTPASGEIIDLARFGELGSRGVLALLADSTNAERPGCTPSERTVGESFDLLFKNAGEKRIIVATFSSNVYRVQQALDAAARYGRKVAMIGRSMENVMSKALDLGYLHAPEGTVVSIDALNRMPDRASVIVTTGTQGEAMSGLTRMAMGDHRKVSISTNDLIIVSAYPIPGNEKFVGRVVNELMHLGAEVVYEKYSDIHVSGHACQDEQKLMLALTKPKYFIPVHGEYKHLKKHADLALRMGMPPENVMIPELGRVMEVSDYSITATSTVTAGAVLVDGLGVGDVGSVVLRDRKRLSEDGLIIIVVTLNGRTGALLSGPDIVSRGFVYVREAEDMMDETRNVVRRVLEESNGGAHDWQNIKLKIRDAASNYLYGMTKRSPMILPVIQEIKS